MGGHREFFGRCMNMHGEGRGREGRGGGVT